jgi:hypothetical protein
LQYLGHKLCCRQAETRRIAVASATISGGNGGDVEITFGAQRGFDFAITGELPN